jgi:hypothetical protein
MTMARPGSTRTPTVVVRSIAFTSSTLDALESLATTVAARTGRKSSASAIVRALLRHAQMDPSIADRVAALVEHEQATEVFWGKQARSR